LKHRDGVNLNLIRGVAPRTGAWIETKAPVRKGALALSPPARGRGLKLIIAAGIAAAAGSPPARGRGLKPLTLSTLTTSRRSPPARGRGLKREMAKEIPAAASRPPHGGVD